MIDDTLVLRRFCDLQRNELGAERQNIQFGSVREVEFEHFWQNLMEGRLTRETVGIHLKLSIGHLLTPSCRLFNSNAILLRLKS